MAQIVNSLRTVGAAGSGTIGLRAPGSGIVPGDLLVAGWRCNKPLVGSSPLVPSGWTQVTPTSASPSQALFIKVAESGDISKSWTFGTTRADPPPIPTQIYGFIASVRGVSRRLDRRVQAATTTANTNVPAIASSVSPTLTLALHTSVMSNAAGGRTPAPPSGFTTEFSIATGATGTEDRVVMTLSVRSLAANVSAPASSFTYDNPPFYLCTSTVTLRDPVAQEIASQPFASWQVGDSRANAVYRGSTQIW